MKLNAAKLIRFAQAAIALSALPGLLWGRGFVFGFVLGAIGQLGDLLESLMKRDAEVKDSGRIIPGFGMPLGEFFWLDDLAAACAADGRWAFLFASAPLNVRGGVGSPPNGLAVR